LKSYGIRNTNLKWFRNYLSGRKQGVSIGKFYCSRLRKILCGVPQGSILGPLLFLIYINDLHKSSSALNCILFADDTNLFYSSKNIKTIFHTVNNELTHINEWFKANKLSLNITKTKYTLFMKSSRADNLPLKLPNLNINKISINRAYSMKFLGIIIDEHLNWKEHIKLIENKTSKNLGIMYKAKHLLNKNCLKHIYYAFIHSYLNYGNIVWGSNYHSHLKKLYVIQKKACRIIMNKDRYAEARPLLKELGILNPFQLNIFHTILFMFRLRNEMLPKIFKAQFSVINHRYPTRHSINNYTIPKSTLRKTDFAITYRGPRLWNSIPTAPMKNITSFEIFKSSCKQLLLNSQNETNFF